MRTAILKMAALLAVLALLVGCATEKHAPIGPDHNYDQGEMMQIEDPFASAMNSPDPTNPTVTSYINIYLPPGYDAEGDPYPVLYLLHGFGQKETFFTQLFDIPAALDRMIGEGEIRPMVVVMPNGYNPYGGSFYTNSLHPAVGTAMDHITQHVIGQIEANPELNVRTDAAGKAIAGHSMGGFGALRIAQETGQFDYIATMSAPIAFEAFANPEFIATLFQVVGYDPTQWVNPEDPFAELRAVYDFQYKFTQAMVADAGEHPETAVIKMVFAMTAAFSPHLNPDPASFGPSTIPALVTEVDLEATPPTATYDETVPFGIDLPFGPDGAVINDLFANFLANDAKTLLQDPAKWANIENARLFADNGEDDPLVPPDILMLFTFGMDGNGGYTAANGGPPDVFDIYPGVFELEAGHAEMAYERVKSILRWFNDGVHAPAE